MSVRNPRAMGIFGKMKRRRTVTNPGPAAEGD